ncbi:MAG: lysine--tRNA ligase, partial [Chloroflexi bacterium]|nr:lysine--tRNA ligase [Chloroflexota bacterium]
MTVAVPREVFWADAEASLLARDRSHTIRDSKTPSGAVPISGLRGPIITSALYRTFKGQGLTCRFAYTIDDYDPMDSQSMRSREGMSEHMGKPLCTIPSPDGDPAKSYAQHHAERFIATFARLGIVPDEFTYMSALYRSGALDRSIDLVLRNAAAVREIYARVANVRKDDDWYPVSLICERCGKIGTTKATGYDGTLVTYECLPRYVEWADGCGHKGRTSPFKGGSKLLWNLQWCAQWDYFDVTYEEGGKDLLTAGGSRDRSNEIYRAVWGKEPPFGLQHEFLTLGGKKMSTSKGVGALAHELVELYQPEIVRFLMIRTHPKRHIEFDPTGPSLSKLYDEYDRCGEAFAKDLESDLGRVWALAQVSEPRAPGHRARFSDVANWIQIPSIERDLGAHASGL